MKEKKKPSATKSPLSKAKIKKVLNVSGDAGTEIFYVRVKPVNKKFMEAQAEAKGLSLSKYTDSIFDNLRG